MSKEPVNLLTIEDLVEYVIGHPDDTSKYELSEVSLWKWDNLDAGVAWNDKWDELQNTTDYSTYYSDPGVRASIDAREKTIQDERPSMHVDRKFSLVQKVLMWSTGRHIHLSVDLGEQIDAVWTKVPYYRGSDTLKNSVQGLTLAGILGRLGRTDAKNQVKAAQAKIKAAREKEDRNNIRLYAAKKAQELLNLMNRTPEIIWPAQLTELVNPKLED
jgi:hypothetical protein